MQECLCYETAEGRVEWGMLECQRMPSYVFLVEWSRTKCFRTVIAARSARWYALNMMRCAEQSIPASPASSVRTPTGASMKLSISYKNVEPHKPAEKEVERYASKLNRLLKSYEPDLVLLHGVFTKNPHREENSFSLNLSLPTGTLHATGTGENVRASCKQAFTELESQLKKHQSRLRKDYEWKRKRPRPAPALS
jgi:ribosomal subunit interface protein